MSTSFETTLRRDAIPSPTGSAQYVLSGGRSTTVEQVVSLPIDQGERGYVSALWAQDWDSAEDAGYDHL